MSPPSLLRSFLSSPVSSDHHSTSQTSTRSSTTGMEEETRFLDMVMVSLGLLIMAIYHAWLLLTIIRHPKRTVIGLNALARNHWVRTMMSDPMKNGVLAVQTVRNNIMASTVLATTAITLSSLISVFVGITAKSPPFLSTDDSISSLASVKFFAISLCFIFAFLCNVQSIRYYAHVSFLLTVPPTIDGGGGLPPAYVTRSLNRGSFFWSLGLRAFYVSFTLFLWIFGPIPMFACCVVMCFLLYFLDIASESTRDVHDFFSNGEALENGRA